jgi:hypothetical protein
MTTEPAVPSGMIKGKTGLAMACLNNLVLGILLTKRNTAQFLLLEVTSPPHPAEMLYLFLRL